MISLYITLSGKYLHIHKFYNLVNAKEVSTSISLLKQVLAKNLCQEHIALGDINLYHKLWERPDTLETQRDKAEELLKITQG